MKRYEMVLVARCDEELEGDIETPVKANITAKDEVTARRTAIHRALANDMAISFFQEVHERSIG